MTALPIPDQHQLPRDRTTPLWTTPAAKMALTRTFEKFSTGGIRAPGQPRVYSLRTHSAQTLRCHNRKGTSTMPVSEADDFDRYIEGYDEVSTDFGEKIEWKEDVVFIGTYLGNRTVRHEGEDIEAAEFTDDSGEKYWSWQPFQLESALRNIKPGSEVAIRCDGEDPDAPHRKGGNKQLAFTVRKRA